MTSSVLETEVLIKRFGGLIAVDQFDLQVKSGEIRGILGPNGAGKTTLFNLISGLYSLTSGRIRIEGKDISGLSPTKRASRGLGRTFQTPRIFRDLSLFDNVSIGLSCKRHPSIIEALGGKLPKGAIEIVSSLLDFVGLPVDLSLPANRLSFGETKKLQLARAMAGEPILLLLDEPASGLNKTEVVALSGLIRKIQERGITVCLIEHNIRMVMGLCGQVTVLDFGRKIAEGTPDEVRRDPEVIRAYLGESHAEG